ncbi:uncharacterized protein N7483_012749 [Penicillium malachiteum]|uniref:uncharacterized protein n=1 Tax=Penicillium malachiteum TaxID=1324776 RepID=UPI002548474E|nr:uncharacterized protein N7483_012749 [Penicillium malachiteum]KAJ5715568.1 hypothetical protein N7483_012749 [Penicillium malachiteum]
MPVLLRNCNPYYQYLARGHTELSYPPYKKNSDGQVTLIPGEVFCRVRDCEKSRSPVSSTSSLRSHLRTHGYNVEEGKKRSPALADQTAAFQWFEQLMKNQDKKINGEKAKREHENENKNKNEDKGEEGEDEDGDGDEDEDEDEDKYECY